ncbi:pyridoxamine 5'-phosphate oxidase family protein [Rhodococcus sp. NPDC003382]
MGTPVTTIDTRFGDPDAQPMAWSDTERLLADAELYWLSTTGRGGGPHVTPLIGLWRDGAFWFCTGPGEQKARNLQHETQVAVTTGTNTWADGADVVVEGDAHRITDPAQLQTLADAYLAKYGEQWRFEVVDGGFGGEGFGAEVFRVDPRKVLVFAKHPHGQTTHRLR